MSYRNIQSPLAHAFRNPTFHNPDTGKTRPNDNGWQDRHMRALGVPQGFEAGIVGMIESWARYADQHRARYETPIGDDYVLGPAWRDLGLSIRALLDGETGRLDCGTLSGFIHDTLASEGFPRG
jgi:hypothetical protein